MCFVKDVNIARSLYIFGGVCLHAYEFAKVREDEVGQAEGEGKKRLESKEGKGMSSIAVP